MAIVAITGEINSATAARVHAASRSAPSAELVILLDSVGGDTAATFAAADAIRAHRGMTTCRVMRRADSAAVLLLAACRVRTASPAAKFTLHETAADTVYGRLTGRTLRAAASRLDQADAAYRERIVAYIGCDREELAALERRGATLTGQQALDLGLVNALAGCPALTARAREQRAARAEARAPVRWTGAEARQLSAMGLQRRAIGLPPQALRAMLAERAR
jgi:ATP-dependent protease ClpP protease subunit